MHYVFRNATNYLYFQGGRVEANITAPNFLNSSNLFSSLFQLFLPIVFLPTLCHTSRQAFPRGLAQIDYLLPRQPHTLRDGGIIERKTIP